MSLALVTILFFIFLFPGIFFIRFCYSEEFSKQYFKSTYFELLLSTLFPSIILHLLGLFIIEKYFGYKLDFKTVLILLLDVDSLVDKFEAIKIVISSINNIIAYNLYLWMSSAVLGYSVKKIVRKLKLDRKRKLLRFQNEWHYLITGEILDFPKILGEANDIDFVSVDAMVEKAMAQ